MRADIDRYRRSNDQPSSTLRLILFTYGLQATLVYRFGRSLTRLASHPTGRLAALPLWVPYAIASWLVRKSYGIDLALSAHIGPGLYIGHFGGIRIANCEIGSYCSIAQQTVIGDAHSDQRPIVGTGVWIGAHARILGNIRVGDGATISAGAKVRGDVGPRMLVMGDPARTVSRNYDNSSLLLVADRAAAASATQQPDQSSPRFPESPP